MASRQQDPLVSLPTILSWNSSIDAGELIVFVFVLGSIVFGAMTSVQPRDIWIRNSRKEFVRGHHWHTTFRYVQKLIDRRNRPRSTVKVRWRSNKIPTGTKSLVILNSRIVRITNLESVLQNIQHGTRNFDRSPLWFSCQKQGIHERVSPTLFRGVVHQTLAQPFALDVIGIFGMAHQRYEILVYIVVQRRSQSLAPSLPNVFVW